MTESPRIRLYIKPGCPWCVDAVRWLDREGYAYDTLDVIADETLFEEMIRLSSQSKAPTLTYGELLLPDFGVDELEAFLEKHDIHP